MNNRREFLTSAAAGLTTALSAKRVLGANDRLTGGFIGVGTMGSENLKVALEHSVRVGAVCDVYQPHLERAGALARREGRQTERSRGLSRDPGGSLHRFRVHLHAGSLASRT